MDLRKVFEEHQDEFLRFERVANKFTRRPDLHAFILLDQLVPGEDDMVAAADHDEVQLCTNLSELAARATEDQIVELIRCGVRYRDEGLRMFV